MWNNKKQKNVFLDVKFTNLLATIINILNYISKKWTNIQEASG